VVLAGSPPGGPRDDRRLLGALRRTLHQHRPQSRCSRCCSSSSSGCGSRRRSNLSGVKNMDPVVAGRRRSLGRLWPRG